MVHVVCTYVHVVVGVVYKGVCICGTVCIWAVLCIHDT